MRVGFVLRSTEIHPELQWFVPSSMWCVLWFLQSWKKPVDLSDAPSRIRGRSADIAALTTAIHHASWLVLFPLDYRVLWFLQSWKKSVDLSDARSRAWVWVRLCEVYKRAYDSSDVPQVVASFKPRGSVVYSSALRMKAKFQESTSQGSAIIIGPNLAHWYGHWPMIHVPIPGRDRVIHGEINQWKG